MLKRVITGVCALCVLIPVLWFSETVVLPIAIAAVALISVFEMSRCMGYGKKLYITLPVYVFAAASPFLVRYLDSAVEFAMIAFICAVAYLMYLFVLIIYSHGRLTYGGIGSYFAVTAYIVAALNSIIYIRFFDGNGKYVYLLIFLGAWITDTFAYFTGVLIGKHKLIEDVSPKKTIEGSIGGIVFCSLSYIIFGIVTAKFFSVEANLVMLAVSGVLMSVVSQIGDLIMSVIKRYHGVKDYGKIFPGHGGMLDRFDSILAVSIGLACICIFVRLTGIQIMQVL